MALQGHAPALLGHAQLAQDWWLVVEEFIDAIIWDEVIDKPYESLSAAVHALHAAGYVHGDLRSCNILVFANVVLIVDFEWAGPLGKARYPFFMNHTGLQWPDGAHDGACIAESHDLWWLKQLTSC